jgi:copper transport protein
MAVRVRMQIATLAVAGSLVAPATADAHAVLRHSTPHADQSVASAPPQVIFDFNEPVGAGPGSIRLFDERGRRLDNGEVVLPRAKSAGVRVPGTLPRGVYTATYRVISADGHPVSGGISFGVRAAVRVGRTGPTVDQLLADQQPGAAVEAAYGIARGLHYAALVLLLAALPFWWLVWRAGRGTGRWPHRLLRVAGVAGLVTAALGILLQGVLAAGLHLDHLFSSGVTSASFDTDAGRAWLVRTIAWAVAVPALWPSRPLGGVRAAIVGLAGTALVASFPYGGHATTQTPEGVLVPADVLHVVAAAAWLGGLVLLLAAFWPRRGTPTGEAWHATAAFSRTAVWAIAAIVIAGSVQAWFYLGSLSAFVEHTYGVAVLAKIALVAAIVGIGAANRRRVAAATDRAASALRRAMVAEVVIAVAILAATSVLVRAAPPKTIGLGPQQKELNLGPMRLELVVEPAKVGRNAFHLYLFNRRTGAQVSRVRQLTVTMSNAKAGIAPIALDIPRKGVAHYELLGQQLPASGDWKTVVTARVSDFDEYTAKTTLRVRKP